MMLPINGKQNDRSALNLYTSKGGGVMSCACSMRFQCGSIIHCQNTTVINGHHSDINSDAAKHKYIIGML